MISMNFEENKTDLYNDKMSTAMYGEHNWISNLLENKTRMQHHES